MTEKVIKDGSPAFPCPMSAQTVLNQHCEPFQMGMSLRDYYAGKAMAVIASDYPPKECARLSWQYADAMLEARDL